MDNIYKSELTCGCCSNPVQWYALINRIAGMPISYSQSDVGSYREATVLSVKNNTAMLRIRCKKCDKINTFSHAFD